MILPRVVAAAGHRAALGAAACATDFEAVETVPATEMRPGPGLFSGDAAEFVIYRR